MTTIPTNIAIPVLPTLNLFQTAHFYKHSLGFEVQNDITFAFAQRDGIELHFQRCNNVAVCENTSCYIRVNDAAGFYAEFFHKGVIHPDHHLEDKSWGVREFAVVDNMGNTLWFAESTKTKSQEPLPNREEPAINN